MKKADYGRVVNMASLAGKDGTPLMSAYAASKAGVIAFTKSFGKELADTNIRVNSVAPAAIEADILSQLSPEAVRRMIEISPMKRLGTVEEVSDIVLFLCSEAILQHWCVLRRVWSACGPSSPVLVFFAPNRQVLV